jgi:hypothetical protein
MEWTEASIQHRGGPYGGNIPAPSLSGLTDFFGDIHFKYIPAYLYMQGLEGSEITISYQQTDGYFGGKPTYLVGNASGGETGKYARFVPPPGENYTSAMPDPSVPPFSAVKVFDSKTETPLDYEIELPVSIRVKNEDGSGVYSIQVDMVILLPFLFSIPQKIENVSQVKTFNGENYIKMNMSLLPEMGNEDLFDREGPDDDFLGVDGLSFKKADIELKNIKNSVTGDLFLGVAMDETQVIPFAEGKEGDFSTISFDKEDLDYPFNPNFYFMVKQTQPGDGELRIKPTVGHPEFDFQLAVGVETDINMTLPEDK